MLRFTSLTATKPLNSLVRPLVSRIVSSAIHGAGARDKAPDLLQCGGLCVHRRVSCNLSTERTSRHAAGRSFGLSVQRSTRLPRWCPLADKRVDALGRIRFEKIASHGFAGGGIGPRQSIVD